MIFAGLLFSVAMRGLEMTLVSDLDFIISKTALNCEKSSVPNVKVDLNIS